MDSLGLLQQTDRLIENKKVRKCVNLCTNYINKHGGFTIAGVLTRGLVQDETDATNKVIANDST